MAQEQNEEIIRKKEFTYRGQSLDELKKMDIREFANFLKSNEKRTVLKEYDRIHAFILESNDKVMKGKQIKTHLRDMVIVPKMIGMKIQIHNGKEFTPIEIIPEMLGHRFGEFAATRSRVKHGAAGIGATRSSSSASVK